MNESDPDNGEHNESSEPMHAEFQHRAVTARLREDEAQGVFANAAVILSGQFEFVIDFIVRMGKPDRVMTRVVLPIPVVGQYVRALQDSLANYEKQFGTLPELPRPANAPNPTPGSPAPSAEQPGGFVGAIGPSGPVHADSNPETKPKSPSIEEIYDDLKLDDRLLGGVYANAVLIRHSPSEFCFDFVANIFPKSCVATRVFMAIPQVKPLANSLAHSFDQYQRRQQQPPIPPPPPPESTDEEGDL